MKRCQFLKLSSALIIAPFAAPVQCDPSQEKLKNWAGNFEFSTHNVHYPGSVEETQALVKKHSRLKTLGTRHCFNRIADSRDNLLSTKLLNNVVSINEQELTVTVEAGIKYGELCPYLESKGYALHNLASLPHISVAGSVATATHGSGLGNGNLAVPVNAIEMVIADGTVIQLSRKRDGETFLAAVVSLGALGVVTKVTLDLQRTFSMRQHVFLNMPMAQVKNHFNEIITAGYSVSLFTDWQADLINEVWIKSLVATGTNFDGINDYFGASAATVNVHPIEALSAEHCTDQMGVPGPWYDRLPHFKMGFTPSSGKELQSEYFVPVHHALEAIQAVSRLGKQIEPHLFISEIRSIAADKFWMSPCYNQASVSIHFTWKQDWPAVSKLLPLIEKELEPFNVRPHWGKLFLLPAKTLASRYEKLPAFKELIRQYDPRQKFRNDFLTTQLYNGI